MCLLLEREKTLAYSEVCQFSVNYESVMFYITEALDAIVKKNYCPEKIKFITEDHFVTHEHYNYSQLVKINIINTNWKLFTKDN